MKHKIFILMLGLFPLLLNAKELNENSKNEISHLLNYINNSNCEFNRNGTWYKSSEAQKHIQKKYDYAINKGVINSTEDFISYAADKSSMTGVKYKIKCAKDKEITSSEWLNAELTKFRKK
ncbi:MAG: hypothetical protein RLZZ210_790 [Pseudomonadota bacterium]|jgi:hypothetical protein